MIYRFFECSNNRGEVKIFLTSEIEKLVPDAPAQVKVVDSVWDEVLEWIDSRSLDHEITQSMQWRSIFVEIEGYDKMLEFKMRWL